MGALDGEMEKIEGDAGDVGTGELFLPVLLLLRGVEVTVAITDEVIAAGL
jgi:hypothetical protein